MANEWITLISTAVGGLVGVSGTLGATWLTQRREERAATRHRGYAVQDASREERKAAYLRFLAAVTELERATSAVTEQDQHPPSSTTPRATLVSLQLQLNEVRVIGSDVVSRAAYTVMMSAADVVEAAEEEPPRWELIDGGAMGRLLGEMWKDLRLNVLSV